MIVPNQYDGGVLFFGDVPFCKYLQWVQTLVPNFQVSLKKRDKGPAPLFGKESETKEPSPCSGLREGEKNV